MNNRKALVIPIVLITSFLLVLTLVIHTNLTANPPQEIFEYRMMATLNKTSPYKMYENLRILGPIKQLKEFNVLVVAYDGVLNEHYVNYVVFNDKGDKIELLSGGGSAANDKDLPISFASGWGETPYFGRYLVTYGEVFDQDVSKIEIVYDNNESVIEEVINNGYLAVKEGVLGVKSLKVFNIKSDIIFQIPPS